MDLLDNLASHAIEHDEPVFIVLDSITWNKENRGLKLRYFYLIISLQTA